jgi:predicted phage terminase large subunit-like protein
MILDDIVKDFADAHSDTNREFIWDWWTANSRTRLHPPALVVVIGTRWHEDDIIGRLLSPEHEGDPEQWEVISFPAIAEDNDVLGRKEGEPLLSPIVRETARKALERWEDIKQAVGTYAWAALFQQRPAPAAGAIFNNDWWKYWRSLEELPDFEQTLTSWDCAFKNTKQSDWVVGQLWGVHGADRYLLKQVRKKLSFTETLTEMRSFINDCNELVPEAPTLHLVEDKANGTAVIDVLKSSIAGMVPINPTDSKEARARAVSPMVEAGNVYLPASVDWLTDFLSEHRAFPNAKNDDQVDCLTQALRRTRAAATVTTAVATASLNRGYRRGGTIGRRR